MFGSGSALLRNQGVDILLNIYFGVTINAARGVTNKVQTTIYTFITNFQMAVNPQLTISIAQGDLDRNHTLVIQGSRFSFFLLTIFSVPLLITTPQLLSIWLVEVPPYTVEFIRWTFIYLLWDSISRFLINSVLAYGKIRTYQIVVGGTKLFAVPIVWVALELGASPLIGVWVNIFLELICLCQRLYFNKIYNKLSFRRYLNEVVIRCWIVFAIALGVNYLFMRFVTNNFFINAPLGVLLACASIWYIGTNKEEKHLILSKSRSVISRKINTEYE